jgi:tetratricopeptide (TPR) repeat protein
MDHDESLQEQINSIITLFSNGHIQKALDAVETLTKSYPNDPVLYNISGACFAGLGQFDTAIKNYKKSLAIKPDYAEAHNNLAGTLQELGQLDDAVKSYEQALAIKPDYAEAFNNLGITLKELGQLDTAVNSYKKVLAINPNFAEAHFNLAVTLQELDQLDDALKSYEKAITIKPKYAEAHFNLGNTLRKLGQLDEAVKCYEKAISIEVDFAEAHHNLAFALQQLGEQDKAIKCYKKALAIKPDYHEALTNLGISYQQLGQINDSINQYETALSINPYYAEAYYHLSYLKKYTANDPQITKMKSLLSDSKLSKSDRINLCFALAKVNENLDNQDEFFNYLHEANRLRKQELNYSFDLSKTLFSTLKEMFSSAYSDIEKSLSSESSTIHPIFIAGMPRSGSTLVEQIISSHHAVHGAGELSNLPSIILPIATDYANQGMNKLPEKTFLSIREQYLDVLSNLNVPESVITDKFLLNFLYIGFILTAFPNAKIVHLKRDARATCWSNYNCFFSSPVYGFSHNIDDLTGFYGLYIDLMDFWHQLFPGKIYDMCYEDLTANQEEETRKLLQYCELDWDKNCLSFHKNKRAVQTASSIQVREKIYQGSSEVWKKYEAHLKPLIKALSSF